MKRKLLISVSTIAIAAIVINAEWELLRHKKIATGPYITISGTFTNGKPLKAPMVVWGDDSEAPIEDLEIHGNQFNGKVKSPVSSEIGGRVRIKESE